MSAKKSRELKQFERFDRDIKGARMQAIYQPVIKALLENGKQATWRTIARHLMSHDLVMIKDYEDVFSPCEGGR